MGTASNPKGFYFRDRESPCNRLWIRNGKFVKTNCKSRHQPLEYDLQDGVRQGGVHGMLRVGSWTYCTKFEPGRRDDAWRYSGDRYSSPPADCVEPPSQNRNVRSASGGGSEATIYYHLDHLGGPQLVTNHLGQVVEQLRYSPFGELRDARDSGGESLDTASSEFRFTGHRQGDDAELLYLGARHYDPGLGLFLSHDPLAQFPSPYSYGNGNPLNGTDPTGAYFEDDYYGGYYDDYYGYDDGFDSYYGGTDYGYYGGYEEYYPEELLGGYDPGTYGVAEDDYLLEPLASSDFTQQDHLDYLEAQAFQSDGCPGVCHFGNPYDPTRQSSPGVDEFAARYALPYTATVLTLGGGAAAYSIGSGMRLGYVAAAQQIRAQSWNLASIIGAQQAAPIAVNLRNSLGVGTRANLPSVARAPLEAYKTFKHGNPMGPTAGRLLSRKSAPDVIHGSGKTSTFFNRLFRVP